MFDAIKTRLQRCETWMQPHDDITWLVARVDELEAALLDNTRITVYGAQEGRIHKAQRIARRALKEKT